MSIETVKLWTMDLQHFADLPHVGDGEIRDDVDFDGDLDDEPVLDDEDGTLDGEDNDDLDDDAPEDGDDVNDEDDDDGPADPEGEKTSKDPEKTDKSSVEDEVRFSPKQQEKVDAIVKGRLERAEVARLRELSRYAGDSLTNEDVQGAARLWGLLRRNPDLSRAIDQLIARETQAGRVVHHQVDSTSERERELAMKEAIIDLKATDRVFSRHAEAILSWAEDQGFAVEDKKSLHLAYMAWKGENARLLNASKALRDKKKNAASKDPAKQQAKRRATVEAGSRGSGRRNNVDYTKMADEDILRREGLSLFTDSAD